eukprot:g15112.t1
MSEERDKAETDKAETDSHWSWGKTIYHNPADPRFMVPKYCKWMGWTINFGWFSEEARRRRAEAASGTTQRPESKENGHYSRLVEDCNKFLKPLGTLQCPLRVKPRAFTLPG